MLVPRVAFADRVELRSQQLAKKIKAFVQSTKVHIIAHSMGGLDARRMIVKEGMVNHVATLTTIGAPHLGSPAAVDAMENFGELLALAGEKINLDGVEDLRPDTAKQFNADLEQAEADNEVDYVVYHSQQEQKRVVGVLQRSWKVIHGEEGENDGLASVTSQCWQPLLNGTGKPKPVHKRRFLGDEDHEGGADHLNELGWWDLRELQGWRWWLNPWLRREIRAFEDKVKNAYLKMALEAEKLAEERAEASSTRTSSQNHAESDDAARQSAGST